MPNAGVCKLFEKGNVDMKTRKHAYIFKLVATAKRRLSYEMADSGR